MPQDVRTSPWKFDATAQGQGRANASSYLTISTFTSTHAAETLTITGHGLKTGDGPYRMTTSGADLPNGWAINTDYWLIRTDADTLQVATSLANANAGTAVAISDDGTGTHTLVQQPIFDSDIYIKNIAIIGDGTNDGTVEVTESSGGPIIARAEIFSAATGVEANVIVPVYQFVEGVYINTLDASNAIVLVYVGK